jgi:acyl-CoA thioesterase-1
MMGSDMDGERKDAQVRRRQRLQRQQQPRRERRSRQHHLSRRRWLAHCTVLAATVLAPGLVAPSTAWAAASDAMPARVLVVGDSLSAEYGLARGRGWVALLQQRLAQSPQKNVRRYEAVNASISGDTTAGGRSRLPALLKQHTPAIVILELGGNDALRGLSLDATRANLTEMTRASKAAGAKVVIAGMQLPPNYGRQYGDAFAALFANVAKSEGTALVPFLLHGVADGPQADTMFQPDRIHPKAEVHPIILDNVWPVLQPLLK